MQSDTYLQPDTLPTALTEAVDDEKIQISLGITSVFTLRLKKIRTIDTHWMHKEDWLDWADSGSGLELYIDK